VSNGAAMGAEGRSEPRDEVHHRARATAVDGTAIPLLVVNMSATGLMARCETACSVGDVIGVHLPIVGRVAAEIRWSLGGRIGCQLDRTIPLADYYPVLAAMAKG
jgi:hypothetical protein